MFYKVEVRGNVVKVTPYDKSKRGKKYGATRTMKAVSRQEKRDAVLQLMSEAPKQLILKVNLQ